jgi:hypothetical protein
VVKILKELPQEVCLVVGRKVEEDEETTTTTEADDDADARRTDASDTEDEEVKRHLMTGAVATTRSAEMCTGMMLYRALPVAVLHMAWPVRL